MPDAPDEASSKKKILNDVPDRYKDIKLSPDWYFGPGKRPKRKHRKAHGKIGFIELSRIIGSRWAELDTLNPEIKAFVEKLAKQELDEYFVDMKKYKEMTKIQPSTIVSSNLSTVTLPPSSQKSAQVRKKKCAISGTKRSLRPVRRDAITSTSVIGSSDFQVAPIDISNEIDYFVSRINNDAHQLMPSMRDSFSNDVIIGKNIDGESPFHAHLRQERRNSLLSFLEPLFDNLEQDKVIQDRVAEEEHQHEKQPLRKKQRMNSPLTVAVDICDDEIIRMWKENNDM